MTLPKKEDLLAAGVPEAAIVEGSNHPGITVSTWDVSAKDKAVSQLERTYHMPHVRPQSVLVTPIGNLWDKDAWWHLQDMMLATDQAGYSMSLQEVTDASLFSFEAIPMMRWHASMLARDGGVEWILMVDNDALLEKDTLLRLLSHDRPVVFPYLEDMEKKLPRIVAPLSGPDILEPNQGLIPMRWAAMSVMLFNVRIFNVLSETAWRGSDYLFAQCLNFMGHRIYMDTDAIVKITHGPTRHGAAEYDEYWENHRKMQYRLHNEDRDRQPPPNFNPLKDDGLVDRYGTYLAMPNSVARQVVDTAVRKENNGKDKYDGSIKLWKPGDR